MSRWTKIKSAAVRVVALLVQLWAAGGGCFTAVMDRES